jgi:hypothetical protein
MTDTSQALRSDHALDRPAPAQTPGRWLVWRRMAWWAELLAVGACYLIYESSRTLASSQKAPAVAHGLQILRAEQSVHLDPEATLNHWLNSWDALADLAGYYYSTLHFIVTPLVLVYLFWRRPQAYPRLRSALVMATAAGLVVFIVWPVAPPRFTVPGLTDTLVRQHVLGMSDSAHGVSGIINQYAAMPSLHVGWALWCAVAVVATNRSRWRHLAWLYPTATTLVVLGTANHYLFDAVGGAIVIALSLALASLPRRTTPDEAWTLEALPGALR